MRVRRASSLFVHCRHGWLCTKGTSHRKGTHQCDACRETFTTTVGSVVGSSHVPLHKWALGLQLTASSKKGISAHEFMRNLGLGSYRTAWFMAHRIREAMKPAEAAMDEPIGGSGAVVEVEETYIGKQDHIPHRVKALQRLASRGQRCLQDLRPA